MANVIRIANTGIFYANSFDEVTFNANSGYTKNLMSNSQDFTTGWGISASSVIPNATIAPDGTLTGQLLLESSTNATHVLTKNINLPQILVPYTFSCYIKSYSGDRNFWFQFHESPAFNYVSEVTSNNLTTFSSSASLGGQANPTGSLYSNPTGSITYVNNGWYRISLTVTLSNNPTNTTFVIGLYNNGNQNYQGNGTSGIYIWGAQVEQNSVATIYEPTNTLGLPSSNSVQKIDSNGNIYIAGAYDEVTYNTNSVGAVKNLFNSSQNLLTGNWGFSAGETVTTGTFFTAPDGTQTAQQMVETAVTNSHNLGNYGQSYAGLPYTFSVYLKKGVLPTAPDWVQLSGYFLTFNSCFANFNLTTGQIGIQSACTATMTPVGNGWYRCTITVTCTTTYNAGEFWVGFINNTNQNTRLPSYLGSTTSDMLVWGAQMEQNSAATIYQPTAVSGNIASQNSIVKVENTGNTYTIGNYDEWTGIVPTTNGLILNLDGAFPQSYSGTGLNINDLTGNSNNLFSGNAGSMPLYNPNYGSFYCDGINYKTITFYYTVPSIFYTNAFSLEVWIKPKILNTLASTGADSNIISIIENYGVNGFRFGLQTRNNLTTDTTAGPIFFCSESGGTLSINAVNSSLFPITIGKWSQIVVTYDGVNTGNMYVNGNFLLSSTGTYKPIASSSGGFFGGPVQGTNPMVGEFNSMKWYNRAITAQEVLANFNGLRNRYGI